MKKNKMLRMASVLLVLTLLTTSIIGGTFAKYVTTESATDTARVAKFGVVATVSGDLFGSTYKAVTDADGNTITTYSANGGTVSADTAGTNVVAPGTKNDKGLTLSVTGTPEVATKVTLGDAKDGAGNSYVNSDIYLAEGTYGVMVEYKRALTAENIENYYTLTGSTYSKAETVPTAPATKVYELRDVAEVATDGYYPLTWTVGGGTATAVTKTKVEDVVNVLTGKFNGKNFSPNTAIADTGTTSLSATVGWEWPFSTTDNDAKDTILGDMIAAKLTTPDPIAVVKKNDGAETYALVKYKDITSGAGTIAVAYTGDNIPNDFSSSDICACLTVAFNASLTVEQVD